MFKVKYFDRDQSVLTTTDQYVKLSHASASWFFVYDNGIWYKVANHQVWLKGAATTKKTIAKPPFTANQLQIFGFQLAKKRGQGSCRKKNSQMTQCGFQPSCFFTLKEILKKILGQSKQPGLLTRLITTRIFDDQGNYLDVKSDQYGIWKIQQTRLASIFQGCLPRVAMTKDEIIADLQDELSRLGQKIEFDDRQVSGQISDLMAMKTNFQSAQKQIEQITCQLTAIQKSTTTKPLKEVGSNLVDTNLAKQIAALQGKLGQLQTSQQELASQSPLPPSPITIVCPHQGKKAFGQKPPSSLTNTKPQTTDDQKEMIFFKDGLEELIPPTPLKTFTTTDPTDYPFPTDLKKDEQELIPRSTKDDQVISPKTVSSKPLDEQKSYYGRKDDHYSQEKKVIFPPNELEKGAKRENITPSQTPGAKTPFSVVAEFNIDQELSEAKAEMQTTDHLINQTIAADDNALEELQLKYNQQWNKKVIPRLQKQILILSAKSILSWQKHKKQRLEKEQQAQ